MYLSGDYTAVLFFKVIIWWLLLGVISENGYNCVMYSNSSYGTQHRRQLIHEAGSLSSDEEKRSYRRHSAAAGYQPMSRRTNDISQCSSDVSTLTVYSFIILSL